MTVASFLDDLFKKYPSLKYKDLFMTLNWLKTYSVAHVMSAIWGPCEEYIDHCTHEERSGCITIIASKGQNTIGRRPPRAHWLCCCGQVGPQDVAYDDTKMCIFFASVELNN